MKDKNLEKIVLELYLSGKSQEEIYNELKTKKIKKRKIKSLIKENIFLSPKNIKLSPLLYFFIFLFFPSLDIYIKGDYYRDILTPIVKFSIFISSFFILFFIILYKTKDLRDLLKISSLFIIYLTLSIIILLSVAIYIDMWTIALFPIVIYPTVINEYRKLKKLVDYIKDSSQN